MATNPAEIGKVYAELTEQLADVEPQHDIAKTLRLLGAALKTDGFDISVPTAVGRPRKVNAIAETTVSSSPVDVHAFRMLTEMDAISLVDVLGSMSGWSSKLIEHKGRYFVVAGNVNQLTTAHIRSALETLKPNTKSNTLEAR